jgi:hypothetical protein
VPNRLSRAVPGKLQYGGYMWKWKAFIIGGLTVLAAAGYDFERFER